MSDIVSLRTQTATRQARYDNNAERWEAVRSRDAKAERAFVYAVQTTGVYCRPGCPSRLPKREHVQFYSSAAAAEKAGFSPCKRCHPAGISPRQVQAEAVARACREIERTGALLSAKELERVTGFSRFHFQRLFKRVVGLTPRAYAGAIRDRRIRSELHKSPTVTEAVYRAGFASGSRFYETSSKNLGMNATQFRKGAPGIAVHYVITSCPLGLLLVAATERGVCFVALGDSSENLENELAGEFPQAQMSRGSKELDRWVETILGEIDSPGAVIEVPLDVRGTAFQQRVWEALRQVPLGTTITYSELASKLGQPSAARAVARACATNPVALAVPCHRVVGKDGRLRGFRWGVARKQQLLAREGAAPGSDKAADSTQAQDRLPGLS